MSLYLERYGWPDREFPGYSPPSNLEMIVVIPAYNEGNILKAIKSLCNCHNPENTLILVIINQSSNDSEGVIPTNKETLFDLEYESFSIPVLSKIIKLPPKKAGVGLARKVGMDEAVKIFEDLNKDGTIICYDADCECQPNYLNEIRSFYKTTKSHVGLLHYEHDLKGPNIEAIINYELFLRYYVNALRWAKFPFAVQTLGSCISVKSKAYQRQGGMNTRKAGEDFYFIHKMVPLGGIGEINSTCVYPSDRVSDRVPFGTGHAVQKYLDQPSEEYETYNPRIFAEIKQLLEGLEYLYACDSYKQMGYINAIGDFLEQNNFNEAFTKMKKQSPNFEIFLTRFYAWFDAFRVLKFVHFARDHYYPNIEIVDALGWLNHQQTKIQAFEGTKEEKLIKLRKFDRDAHYYIK
ncbi:MAG: glycosyltransferase family A protein [Cyclobacteriaceae bacterium]